MLLLKHKMQLLMTEFIIGTIMSMCKKMFPAQALILNRVFISHIPQVADLAVEVLLSSLLLVNELTLVGGKY